MSIRLKLTVWYSALLAVTLVALGTSVYLFVQYYTFNGIKQLIERQESQVRFFAEPDDFILFNTNRFNRMQLDNLGVQVVIYEGGTSVHRTSNLSDYQIILPYPKPTDKPDPGFVNTQADDHHFLVLQKPVYQVGGNLYYILQIAASTDREERMLQGLRTILVFSSAAVLVVAFTTGLIIARQGLRPLENVIRAANGIENGSNLSMRIPREGPNDEIGRLTDTLNGMLDRIETTYNDLDDAYRAQRRFVSDASHELRTPLTTIRGNIELLEKMWAPRLTEPADAGAGTEASDAAAEVERLELTREAMRDISDEARRMSRLVADMLSLARADAGYEMEKTDVALLPLVEEVARRAQHLPRTADWIVGDLSPLEGAVVHGSPDYLRQLVFIFIENAFKYTPEGRVELRALRADGQAGIVVSDTGIGMNREEIPHIFERFYRADVSRGKTAGTGLGLSIAKWIIDEHGGSVEVETREGGGTTFVVWLPVSFLPPDGSGIMEGPEPEGG